MEAAEVVSSMLSRRQLLARRLDALLDAMQPVVHEIIVLGRHSRAHLAGIDVPAPSVDSDDLDVLAHITTRVLVHLHVVGGPESMAELVSAQNSRIMVDSHAG